MQTYMLLTSTPLLHCHTPPPPIIWHSQTTSAAPHGMIDLVDCLGVKGEAGSDAGSRKPCALQVVTRDEAICLHASSDLEKEGWLAAISK
jgi:hypothetical protein